MEMNDMYRLLPKGADKVTEEYFEEILLEARFIDSVVPDTSFELFGRKFSTPIMTAALSHLPGKDGGDGMVQMAQGAKQAEACAWIGMTTLEQFADIAAVNQDLIRIIKPYANEREIYSRIEQAEELGIMAVGIDVGHIFNSFGQPDLVLGNPMAPKSVKDISRYCSSTKLPFVFKDVLSCVDAQKAIDAGAAAILVGHHHGIPLAAVPPLMILEEIVKTVHGQIPVFVDCGINNGVNAFKAMALGADAVCVGRVLMPEIKKDGADGAEDVIRKTTGILAGCMARTGSPDIHHIDRSVLWRRNGTRL